MMRLECWRKKPAPQGFFLQRVHARCLARSSCDISCIFPRVLSSNCGVPGRVLGKLGERAMARFALFALLLLQADSALPRSIVCYHCTQCMYMLSVVCVFRLTCRPDSSCMHAVSRFLHLSSMACPCKLSSSYVYTSGGPGCMGSRRRR